MLTTAVVYKWRIRNAKYIYLIDEDKDNPEPFIYYINDEMRIYSGDTVYKKVDEIMIKENVSSLDNKEDYEKAFVKMSGLLKSDDDGRYLHLLDYSAYMKDIPECVEGATDVTCNPIDIVFTADAKSLPSGVKASAEIDDVENIQLPNGSRQRTFNINFGIPVGKDGNNGTDGLSAYEIAVKNGFEGTEDEWLKSLKGEPGKSIPGENGKEGKSAYDIAREQGFKGSADEWLNSLKGDKGDDGTIGIDEIQEDTIYKILGYNPNDSNSNISYFPYVYNKFISKKIEGESEPEAENLFYFSSAGKDIKYKRTYYLNIQFDPTSAAADCVVNPINGYKKLCLRYSDKSMIFYDNGLEIYRASENSDNIDIQESYSKLFNIYNIAKTGTYTERETIEDYGEKGVVISLLDSVSYIPDTTINRISDATIFKFRVEVEETPKKSKNEFIVDKFDKISIKPETELNSNIHLKSDANEDIVTKSSDITQNLDNTSIQYYVLESEEIGYQSTMQFNAQSLNIKLLKINEFLKNKDKLCEIIIGNDNFEINHKNTNIFKVTSKLATFKPEVKAKVNGITDVYLGVPIGTIVMWPGDTAPYGWLICNGQSCDKYNSPHSKLYEVIGNKYNNEDTPLTKFNVPNLQSRFPLGASPDYSLGVTGGEKEVTLKKSQIPAHNHQLKEMLKAKSSGSGWVGVNLNGGGSGEIENFAVGAGGSFPKTENNTGGGLAHNNMPPYFPLNFIIKYM